MDDTVRPGWSVERIRTLGDGARVGGESFSLGHRPGVSVVAHADRHLLMVGNEFGYLEVVEDFLSPTRRVVPSEKVGRLDDHHPLGVPAGSFPDCNIYPCSYPADAPGAFDIVAGFHSTRNICRMAKLPDPSGLVFGWHWPVLDLAGIPAAFRPERGGRPGLLVGGADGALRLHRRKGEAEEVAFEGTGEPVLAGDEPIEFPGWLYPCVTDWDGEGRQDLLIGTADGRVFLYRDVGDGNGVRFDRGRALRTPEGLVEVGSFAAPAAIPGTGGVEGLLVAGGEGALYHYPVRERDSLVTDDLAEAFAGCSSYIAEESRPGFWCLRRGVPGARNGQALTTSPAILDPARVGQPSVDEAMANTPPELVLPIDRDGRFEVHVGFHEPDAPTRKGRMSERIANHALLRLSGDDGWTIMRTGETHRGVEQELFFKAADLKGESLRIRPVPGGGHYSGSWPVHLDYVRLVPADDVKACRTTSLPDKAFVVAAIADIASWYRCLRLTSQDDMDLLFDVHKQAGFDRLYYKLGGAAWEYPSEVPMSESCIEPFGDLKDGDYADGRDFLREWDTLDRLAWVRRAADRHGIVALGWIRLQNYGEHIHNGYPVSVFHRDHPRLWEKDRQGNPLHSKMSLAFPEVRRYELAIIREAIERGLRGILIDFLRQLPAVCYAEPVRERFAELHGEDARQALPTDPRLLKAQAEFSNIFLAEVRAALNEFDPRPELHVRLASPRLGHGLDPAAIAASGDVDEIIIEHRGPTAIEPDLGGMLAAAEGTGCRVCPSYQRTYWGASRFPMRPEIVRRTSEKYYAMGARSIAFYESTAVVWRPDLCRAIRRLKDPNEYFPIAL